MYTTRRIKQIRQMHDHMMSSKTRSLAITHSFERNCVQVVCHTIWNRPGMISQWQEVSFDQNLIKLLIKNLIIFLNFFNIAPIEAKLIPHYVLSHKTSK